MTNKIFKRGEPEVVELLAKKGIFSVLNKMEIKMLEKEPLTHVPLSRFLKLDKTIRNYVRAFEIDHIAIFRKHNKSPNSEVAHEETLYGYMGIEVKYFYKTNLENRKYHQGIGQFIEYLKWGFDYATLVHIFDRNIAEDNDELKNKIDEYKEPAFKLFKLFQDKYKLPLAYVYLIADETIKDENIDLKSKLSNDKMCYIPLGNTQPNPFKEYFSWDEIPEHDNGKLIELLKRNYNIDWVVTAKIEKIDDDKIIRVSTEKNSLLLILNDEKNKVNLKIDDGRTGEFIANTMNGKLNIYFRDNEITIKIINSIDNEVRKFLKT